MRGRSGGALWRGQPRPTELLPGTLVPRHVGVNPGPPDDTILLSREIEAERIASAVVAKCEKRLRQPPSGPGGKVLLNDSLKWPSDPPVAVEVESTIPGEE